MSAKAARTPVSVAVSNIVRTPEHQRDAMTIAIPGGLGHPAIANASDAQLLKGIADSLEVVEGVCRQHGLSPNADGTGPQDFIARAPGSLTEDQDIARSTLRKRSRFLRCARAELAFRAAEHAETVGRERAAARKDLEAVLDSVAAKAEEFREHSAYRSAALVLVREVVAAVEFLGTTQNDARQFAMWVAGVELAARTLGRPVPKLPRDLAFERCDVAELLAPLSLHYGRGFATKSVEIGPSYKAQSLAEKLSPRDDE